MMLETIGATCDGCRELRDEAAGLRKKLAAAQEDVRQLERWAGGLRAGLAISVDLLEELQHAWEIGQGYHQEEDPQRCPDPVCDGYIGPDADLDVEHADGCRYVKLRKLAGMEG